MTTRTPNSRRTSVPRPGLVYLVVACALGLLPSVLGPAGASPSEARPDGGAPRVASKFAYASAAFSDTPTLSVASASDGLINLSWTPVTGATNYRVERKAGSGLPYAFLGTSTTTGFADAAVGRGNAYLYRVCKSDASGAACVGPYSNAALATAYTFLDDPIITRAEDPTGATVTQVKALHVTELRDAVNAVRRLAGRADASWTNPTLLPQQSVIQADDVRDLRARLGEALSDLGIAAPSYTDPTLSTGQTGTLVFRAHVSQLRAAATRGVAGSSPPDPTDYSATLARLDPSNRTGGAAVDLVSRNFNWSLPVVGLPGRAGHDLGLTLSYNSLVWTKSGNSVYYDLDGGFPAPGFRLGFPSVEHRFYDAQAGRYAYLVVTPAGARVELRQTSDAAVYEAADSSHLWLKEEATGNLTLRATDGTQLTYEPAAAAFRCAEVKDADGNFITVTYGAGGRLAKVKDTLAREVNFNYYPSGELESVTQLWHREQVDGTTAAETHNWARFEYEDKTLQPNFIIGLNPSAPPTVRALSKVKLADDSSYTFDYNSYGQVRSVSRNAPDGRLLERLSYTFDLSTAQSDCPRFTKQKSWAEYWHGDDGDGEVDDGEESVTTFNQFNFAGGVAEATTPDGTLYRELYQTAGRRKGLTTATQYFSHEDLNNAKKWTETQWEQDDESVDYTLNPRVKESSVYDPDLSRPSGYRRRRTSVAYNSHGLPQDVYEYDDDATTVLRRTHTEYLAASVDPSGAYTLKRIIGLPVEMKVYGTASGQEKLHSKVTFEYDQGGEFLADAGALAQHDAAYGVGLTARGHLTRTRRWDVEAPDVEANSVKSEAGYDTAGSLLFSRDARGHQTAVEYGGATRAYPTKVTDPDGYYSTAEYNYDMGAATRAVDPKGAASKTLYDQVGRALRVVNQVNGAVTRWEYGAGGRFTKQFMVVDTGKTETFVLTVLDGAGRVRGTLGQLPESDGGYTAQRFHYDEMGRRAETSNPTEVSVNAQDRADVLAWQPFGDDAAGWVWTTQTYDWKGRPLVTTLPKLNPNDPNEQPVKREVSYGGCGCAGGDIVTLTDEGTWVGEGAQAVLKRRRQRVYHDIMGRVVKAESYNWDGTVYSTTVTEYDGPGPAQAVKVYQGDEAAGGPYQQTVMSYDGHGRLRSRQTPEQLNPVTYLYNKDDTVSRVTDPRLVVADYTYNDRHQVKTVNYTVPPALSPSANPTPAAPVPATAPVSFDYDEAGNRTSMSDGTGAVTYHYDALSRLRWEERTFQGLPDTYRLTYEYTLSGLVKSVTDNHANSTVDYGYDDAGRLHGVTGTAYADVSTFASNFQYRAWGGLKSFGRGDGRAQYYGYDTRLRLVGFEIAGATPQGPSSLMRANYEYNPDGRVRFVDEQLDEHDRFDRGYAYDSVGRLSQGVSGVTARNLVGLSTDDDEVGPYSQVYTNDVWGNLKGQWGEHWSQTQTFTATYTNNRRQGWAYDAAGRVVADDSRYGRRMVYDAAGRMVEETERQRRGGGQSSLMVTDLKLTQGYDGDGARVRRVERTEFLFNNQPTVSTTITYYLRSTVLGAVAELDQAGQRRKGYVVAAGRVVVKQWAGLLYWQNTNPVTGDALETATQGYAYASDENVILDPQGRDVGSGDPYADEAGVDYGGAYETAGNGYDDVGHGCAWPDGMPAPCNVVEFAKRTGLYDRWENPVKVVERERGYPSKTTPVDFNPDFMGYDYWAGADLQSSSELRRNPPWVSRGEAGGGGFFLHESGPQDPSMWGTNDWDKLRWGGVPLSPCANKILGEIFEGSGLDVSKLRIRIGIPNVLREFATMNPAAITIGNTIFIANGRESFYDVSTIDGLVHLAHEAWHAMQAAQMGGANAFKAAYLAEVGKLKLTGKDPYWDNYYEASAEYGAYPAENEVRSYLKGHYKTDRPCDEEGLSTQIRTRK